MLNLTTLITLRFARKLRCAEIGPIASLHHSSQSPGIQHPRHQLRFWGWSLRALVIIRVLHGVVLPVVHAPTGSIKYSALSISTNGASVSSAKWGQLLWPQGYAFVTDCQTECNTEHFQVTVTHRHVDYTSMDTTHRHQSPWIHDVIAVTHGRRPVAAICLGTAAVSLDTMLSF